MTQILKSCNIVMRGFGVFTGPFVQILYLTSSSTFAMSYPGSSPGNQWFRPKRWVTDSGLSKIFSDFRGCNAGLGNRAPAKNGRYYKLCPLCEKNGQKALNNEVNDEMIILAQIKKSLI